RAADHLRLRAGRAGPVPQTVHGSRRVLRAPIRRGRSPDPVPGRLGARAGPVAPRLPRGRGVRADPTAAAVPARRPQEEGGERRMNAIPTDIDHVGIAVRDLDAAVEHYRRTLGVEPAHREVVEDQGVEEVLFAVGTSYVQL